MGYYELMHKNEFLTDSDIELRMKLMRELRQYFIDLQNGRQLWKYNEIKAF